MSDAASAKAPAKPSSGRRLGLSLLALVVIVAGAGWGAYWYLVGQHHVSTDDAYVSGDVVDVTSEVPGTVIALHVDNTQLVTQGAPLVSLDPADANIALANAEAELGLAVRQVRTLMAQTDQLHAQVARDQANLDSALEDYHRRLSLVRDGGVSKEELSHARDTITELTASVDASRAAYEANEAQIAGTTVATHPTVMAAAARLRNAALALHRAEITAPIDGIVAKRSVEIGQRVDAGTPLLSIIPLDDVWIDANFKEVQLKRLRIGQPVTVHADVYGGDFVYHGRVAGVAAGSGSTFALLPAQNASGNWIKIVQRLPVRILLDPAELRAHPLRLGLSTVVDVDVTRTENLRPTPIRNFPLRTRPSAGDDPAVGALIARIIGENAGTPAEVARDPAP